MSAVTANLSRTGATAFFWIHSLMTDGPRPLSGYGRMNGSVGKLGNKVMRPAGSDLISAMPRGGLRRYIKKFCKRLTNRYRKDSYAGSTNGLQNFPSRFLKCPFWIAAHVFAAHLCPQ